MTKPLAALALTLLSLPSSIACAEVSSAEKVTSRDFENCDGLVRGGLADDIFLFVRNGNGIELREDATRYGRAGASACDRALGDPKFSAGHLQRRLNLLQSKALHLIAAEDLPAALAALDTAEASMAANTDRYFALSVGSRIAMIRAYVLGKLDRKDEALQVLNALAGRYNWSPTFGMAVARLRLSIDQDFPNFFHTVQIVGQQSPDYLHEAFRAALLTGHFDEALSMAAYVRFDLPLIWRGCCRFVVPGDDHKRAFATQLVADVQGGTAYAQAALGRFDAARETIAMARTRLQDALALLPQDAIPANASKEARPMLSQQRMSSVQAATTIDAWAQAITLLEWKTEGGLEPAPATDKVEENPFIVAALLFDGVSKPIPSNAGIAPLEALARPEKARVLAALTSFELPELLTQLPQPENIHTLPPIRRAGNGFSRTQNGYSRTLKPGTTIYTIRYHKSDATLYRVEECGVLAAALYAARDGVDSILVLNRRTLRQVDNSAFVDGFENQMDALLVNADSLPLEYEAFRDRLIPVSRIMADVKPAYDIRQLPD